MRTLLRLLHLASKKRFDKKTLQMACYLGDAILKHTSTLQIQFRTQKITAFASLLGMPERPIRRRAGHGAAFECFVASHRQMAHGAPGPLSAGRSGRTWAICTRRAGNLYNARSRLYRSQLLQVNMRWKALAEIYIMHSFAQLCNLNIC